MNIVPKLVVAARPHRFVVQQKKYKASKALGAVVRNPTVVVVLSAPDVVKLLREAVKLQAAIKLVEGDDSTYLDATVHRLSYEAKMRGIVWNIPATKLIKEHR